MKNSNPKNIFQGFQDMFSKFKGFHGLENYFLNSSHSRVFKACVNPGSVERVKGTSENTVILKNYWQMMTNIKLTKHNFWHSFVIQPLPFQRQII